MPLHAPRPERERRAAGEASGALAMLARAQQYKAGGSYMMTMPNMPIYRLMKKSIRHYAAIIAALATPI